jgi:hypothetical protein
LSSRYELRGFRIGAVIAVALVAAAAVWYFAIRDSDNDSNNKASAPEGNIVGPVAATRGDLIDLSQKLGQPIYWAGNQPGTTDLELTQTRDGNVYVRYLTGDAAIGAPKPHYLTVGTYPVPNATKALETISGQPGAETNSTPDGGTAVTNTSAPTSVYVAFPDEKSFEIEVFDPDPAHALDLVTSGEIKTVR